MEVAKARLLRKYNADLKSLSEVYNILVEDLTRRLAGQPPKYNASELDQSQQSNLKEVSDGLSEILSTLAILDVNRDQKDDAKYLETIMLPNTNVKINNDATGHSILGRVEGNILGKNVIYVRVNGKRESYIWDSRVGRWQPGEDILSPQNAIYTITQV